MCPWAIQTHLRDDAPGPDGAAVPDGDIRQDCDIARDPAILTDRDCASVLRAVRAVAKVGVKRVSATVEGHVWSNEGPRANGHEAGVDDGAIEIDKHVAANLDIRSVVDTDGPLDPRVLVKNRIILILCCGRGRKGLIAVRDPVAGFSSTSHSLWTLLMGAHSFQYSAISRRVSSPALLSRFTALLHRRRASVS
jgi:hypothetical protein